MNRFLHSPWLVALAVLALAAFPVWAALDSQTRQAKQAEALLFERSAEVVATQIRLLMSRQMGWQNGVRMRLSNRNDLPERMLDEVFAPGSSMNIPENCRLLTYGAMEGEPVPIRWQRGHSDPALGTLGSDLLKQPATTTLIRSLIARPAQMVSVQNGLTLLTGMTVGGSSPRQARGWLIASWDLKAICADLQLRLVNTDHTLMARPLDGPPLASEHVMEIGEGEARWRVAVSKGPGFAALFPHLSERAITLTGGGCALLLALLAGLVTREVSLRAALDAQRELIGMKNHLLHSVSHEFRTPLSVILSSTELLEIYGPRLSSERRAEALTQIRHSTLQMNEMVGQVILLSRLETTHVPVDPKSINLVPFIQEIAHETEMAAHMRCPIHITAPGLLIATLDSTLLRSVLGNLLSNAVKFSPAGTPVELTLEAGETLRLVIRDRGPGIVNADLNRVREPFFRSSSTAEVPGSGLGLAIADKSASLLGGSLSIQSDASGTTATFTL